MADEEDDSVLDIAEQTNRPNDTAFAQQRIQAWHPILDPVWAICALFYVGAILVPTGKLIFCIECFQEYVDQC